MLSLPTCTIVCSQGLPGAGATTSRPSHLPPSQLCAVREPMRSFPPFSHTLLTKRPRLWYAHRTAAAFTEPGSEASLVPELHVEASVPTSHTALHLPGFQPIRITMDLSPSRVSLAGRSLGCLRVQGMLVHCTVDFKHHVDSANSSSVQVWQWNYWGSIQVLWRGGAFQLCSGWHHSCSHHPSCSYRYC